MSFNRSPDQTPGADIEDECANMHPIEHALRAADQLTEEITKRTNGNLVNIPLGQFTLSLKLPDAESPIAHRIAVLIKKIDTLSVLGIIEDLAGKAMNVIGNNGQGQNRPVIEIDYLKLAEKLAQVIRETEHHQ